MHLKVLISVMLLTASVVSATLGTECTLGSCNTEHAFCMLAHDECTTGLCACGLGYQQDASACKEVINPGVDCTDTNQICGGGSTCDGGSNTCECPDNLTPDNNVCTDQRAAIGGTCAVDADCRLGGQMTECVGSPLECRCKSNYIEDEPGDQCNTVDWQGDCDDSALYCSPPYSCVTQEDNTTLCECQDGYVRTQYTNLVGTNVYECAHQDADTNVPANGDCAHDITATAKFCVLNLSCYNCEEDAAGKCRSTPTPPTTTEDPADTTTGTDGGNGASSMAGAPVLCGLLAVFRQLL